MSPARHHRRRRLGGILAVGSALAIGIGVYVNQNGGGAPPPAPGTANVWVAANGSNSGANCTWNAVPVTDPDPTGASLCADPAKAASLVASQPATILLHSGTYISQWEFATAALHGTSNCRIYYDPATNATVSVLTNCITIQPASGTVTLAYSSGQTVTTGKAQLHLCSNNLYIKNITIQDVTFTEASTGETLSGDPIATGNGLTNCTNQPTNIVLDNIKIGGPAKVGSGTDIAILNSEATGTHDLPWQVTGNNRRLIYNTRFDGYNFQNHSFPTHHMECIHEFPDVSNLQFINNQVLDCPVEGWFMECDGTCTGLTIMGNTFEGPNALLLRCHAGAASITGATVAFNTFRNNNAVFNNQAAGTGCTMSGNLFYGNLNGDCPASNTGVTSSWNVYASAGPCLGDATSAYSQTPAWVSPGTSAYNYALANCTQAAANFVVSGSVSGYPTFDSTGVARPQGSAIDAGAVESCAGGTQTGASLATCSPSACTTPTLTQYTISVPDSDGATATNVNRTFKVGRPGNLTGAAPLLLVMGPQAADSTSFMNIAAANKYVVAYLQSAPHSSQWAGQTIFPVGTGTSRPFATCGSGGTHYCDDTPYVKAAMQAIACTGSAPCSTVDPNKVYLVGASKDGGLLQNTICDTRTSSLVSAGVVVSNLMISPTVGPSETSPPYCPAILGSAAPAWDGDTWGGAAGLAANTDLAVAWYFGDNDGVACAAAPAVDCLNTGYVDGKNRWQFSNPQLAGDSSPPSSRGATGAGSNVAIGRRLGCGGTPSTNTTYGATSKLHKKIYTSCTNSRRATETILVNTGGHAYQGLDGIDSFDTATEAWAFFTAYGGK